MSVKITGLDQLQRKLRDISDKAKSLDGNHQVRFDELFPPAFVRNHTQFQTIDELFAKSGFKVESQDDIKAIPDAEWDTFIAAHTNFKNWHAMTQQAVAEWTHKKLGL